MIQIRYEAVGKSPKSKLRLKTEPLLTVGPMGAFLTRMTSKDGRRDQARPAESRPLTA